MYPNDTTVSFGYCLCGCGEKTTVYRNKARLYCFGHDKRAQGIGPNPSGVCQCGCSKPAPIAKRSNAEKGHVIGQPVRFIVGHNGRIKARASLDDVFWSKFTIGSTQECWIYPTRPGNKYGQMRFDDRYYLAHRLSYEIHYGVIPDGLCVCHNCPGGDNPACVNPKHLWLGTHADNAADKVEKGRQSRGQGRPKAKLTEPDVLEIRRLYREGMDVTTIAKRYNVSHSNVSSIVSYKAWKHVP